MLKRLYVDNFRCLEDFELNFDSINLFLGDNDVMWKNELFLRI